MTFAALDDNFGDEPNHEGLTLAHFGLMALATVYCSRHLTDGILPDGRQLFLQVSDNYSCRSSPGFIARVLG